VAGGLEVQVGVVDAVLADGGQRLGQLGVSSRPKGSSISAWAMARRSRVGSRLIMGAFLLWERRL
jgi:hypothetical protein